MGGSLTRNILMRLIRTLYLLWERQKDSPSKMGTAICLSTMGYHCISLYTIILLEGRGVLV